VTTTRRLVAASLILLLAPFAAFAGDDTDASVRAEKLIAQQLAVQRAALAPTAPKLAADAVLTDIARARSQEMADGAPFSHQNAQGQYPAYIMVRERLAPFHGAIGENIVTESNSFGIDADAFAKNAVDGWLGSPEHRANILSPLFNKAGIGVVIKDNTAYATEVFAGPLITVTESADHLRRWDSLH
jgi:uncharacterized protein YkwD